MKFDMVSMLFSGERVRLRKISTEDIPIYHKWRNDIEVMQFTSPSLDALHMLILKTASKS